jgi:hypothetical protein
MYRCAMAFLPALFGALFWPAGGRAVAATCDCFDYGTLTVDVHRLEEMQEAFDLTVQGSLLLVATGEAGLVILDASAPEAPSLLGAIVLPGSMRLVAGESGLAYAVSDSGLFVLDIGDPASPWIVSRYANPAYVAASGIVAGSGLLILRTGLQVKILDAADPLALEEVATIQTYGRMALEGSDLYVGGSSVTRYDVSVPDAPLQTGRITIPYDEWYETPGHSVVAVREGRAWVYWEAISVSGYPRNGMSVADFSGATPVWRPGTADPAQALVLTGDRAYSVVGGIDVLDTTGDPVWLWRIPVPERGSDIEILGDTLFLAADANGLWSIPLSSPFSTSSLATLPLGTAPVSLTGQHVATDGTMVYAVFDDTLHVLDLADPAHPARRGSISLTESVRSIAVQDEDVAIITYWYDGIHFHYQLKTVDASDPGDPGIAGTLDLPGSVVDAALANGRLWAATSSSTLALDVSDPYAPFLEATWPIPAYRIAVSGDLLVVDKMDDLRLFEIAPDGIPNLVSQLELRCNKLLTIGNLLYAACSDRIVAIDVTDPTAPEILGSAALLYGPGTLAARGSLIFTLMPPSGLLAVDFSDPLQPAILGGVRSPGKVLALGMAGAYPVLLDQAAGLVVAPPQCGTLVPSFLEAFEVLPGSQAITIRWRTPFVDPEPEFRLRAAPVAPGGAGSSRTVPHRRLATGSYEAIDAIPARETPVSVRYSLEVRREGSWIVLDFRTVDLECPPSPSQLLGVHPNPFNPTATITFSIPSPQRLRISVYDLEGRLVKRLRDGMLAPGLHDERWDGRDASGRSVASGMYIVRLQAEDAIAAQKIILAR